MPHISASDALFRIRVLDLTRVRSGPTASRLLADRDADLIEVEPLESMGPDGVLGALRHTPDFRNLQRNKRSLNLKDREGLAIFFQTVRAVRFGV